MFQMLFIVSLYLTHAMGPFYSVINGELNLPT